MICLEWSYRRKCCGTLYRLKLRVHPSLTLCLSVCLSLCIILSSYMPVSLSHSLSSLPLTLTLHSLYPPIPLLLPTLTSLLMSLYKYIFFSSILPSYALSISLSVNFLSDDTLRCNGKLQILADGVLGHKSCSGGDHTHCAFRGLTVVLARPWQNTSTSD